MKSSNYCQSLLSGFEQFDLGEVSFLENAVLDPHLSNSTVLVTRGISLFLPTVSFQNTRRLLFGVTKQDQFLDNICLGSLKRRQGVGPCPPCPNLPKTQLHWEQGSLAHHADTADFDVVLDGIDLPIVEPCTVVQLSPGMIELDLHRLPHAGFSPFGKFVRQRWSWIPPGVDDAVIGLFDAALGNTLPVNIAGMHGFSDHDEPPVCREHSVSEYANVRGCCATPGIGVSRRLSPLDGEDLDRQPCTKNG
nr:hypothetical protein CFP56_13406 [Quercus suber]